MIRTREHVFEASSWSLVLRKDGQQTGPWREHCGMNTHAAATQRPLQKYFDILKTGIAGPVVIDEYPQPCIFLVWRKTFLPQDTHMHTSVRPPSFSGILLKILLHLIWGQTLRTYLQTLDGFTVLKVIFTFTVFQFLSCFLFNFLR